MFSPVVFDRNLGANGQAELYREFWCLFSFSLLWIEFAEQLCRRINDLVAFMAIPPAPARPRRKRETPPVPRLSVRTCQWLYGNPKDRNFCSEPALPGKPWCALHDDICHLKTAAG